jgi:hypothetical protein
MPSAVRDTLERFLAGRAPAERVVIAVAAAYYGHPAAAEREHWRPVIDVIDRASPGIVELGGVAARPGFAVRLAERPFPREFEAALRGAAAQVLATGTAAAAALPAARVPAPAPAPVPPAVAPRSRAGLVTRLVRAVRRWFSAAA